MTALVPRYTAQVRNQTIVIKKKGKKRKEIFKNEGRPGKFDQGPDNTKGVGGRCRQISGKADLPTKKNNSTPPGPIKGDGGRK